MDGCGVDSGGSSGPAVCRLADQHGGGAEQAAAQAQASAAAYEAAFAGVVPPAVIAANRSLLATLVATNFLGINTPAIAATEAQYAEMWVQDAVTLYHLRGRLDGCRGPSAADSGVADHQPGRRGHPIRRSCSSSHRQPGGVELARVLGGLLAGDPSSIGTGLFNVLPVPCRTS